MMIEEITRLRYHFRLAGITYQERTVDVAPGDTVLVMTDGLVEAVNPDGELFGYSRAAEHLATLTDRSAAEVVDGMFEAVEEFLAGNAPQDDITWVAIRIRARFQDPN